MASLGCLLRPCQSPHAGQPLVPLAPLALLAPFAPFCTTGWEQCEAVQTNGAKRCGNANRDRNVDFPVAGGGATPSPQLGERFLQQGRWWWCGLFAVFVCKTTFPNPRPGRLQCRCLGVVFAVLG